MRFDLVVIGAGSGGTRAARMVAQSGAKVAVIESSMMGGTCVNVGCVPKKLYVNAGLFPHYQKLAGDYGWSGGHMQFSLRHLRDAKDREIARLQSVYRKNIEASGVTIFDGKGKLVAADCIEVGAKRLYTSRILLATGTTSTMPSDFPGIEYANNSDAIFTLENVPPRSLVYGGSYIAVELAGVLARLGSKVDLVYRGAGLLKNFDADLVGTLQTMLEHDGIKVHLNTTIESLEKNASGIVAHTAKHTIASDFVLFALGRHANLAGSGVRAVTTTPADVLALKATKKGFLQVDDNYQTSTEGIFALGDLIGTAQLTPLAIAQALDFSAKHFAVRAPKMPKYIPTAVFTQPPLASVGVQEHELQKAGQPYKRFSGKFTPLHLSLGEHHERVHCKILVEQPTDVVVGVHMLGDYSGEIMQTIAAAMEAGITKAQLDATLAIHPTVAEELVTSYLPDTTIG